MIYRYLFITPKHSSEPPREDISRLFAEFILSFDQKGNRVYTTGVEEVCMGKFNANQARALFAGDAELLSRHSELKFSKDAPFIGRVKLKDFVQETYMDDLALKFPTFDFGIYF